MQDNQIIDLYFARDEQAITQTQIKYGDTCMKISYNLLHSRQDAEECVNDTYLSTWRAIPPQRPQSLGAFVCRIVRNLSLSRFRALHRQKRNRDMEVAIEELSHLIAAPEDGVEELSEHISNFLDRQEKNDRLLFMGRYFHTCPVKELAPKLGMTVEQASTRLYRMRERLRIYLVERGYHV